MQRSAERTRGGAAALAVPMAILMGCAAPALVPSYPALPQRGTAARAAEDDAARLGGRLYDDPWKELALGFVPDDPHTPAADGKGGPFGDGTLPDAEGKPMLNVGHDYRPKNLLGWDLHGAAGISSKHAQGSACVLLPDLLKNSDSREIWIARLTRGEDAIPAYGSVLSSTQIGALVDFVLGVRDGVALPTPDDLFSFDPSVPGYYRLTPGGDAERGHAFIATTCASCHGADGTQLPLEHGAHSLGTFLRSSASEAWLKILAGNAGTRMGPQLPLGQGRVELTQLLRDVLAAGCSRVRYPKPAAATADVADGDARCGAYLK